MHEDGTEKYKCDMCEFSTLNKSNLTKHIKSIHLKEKHHCNLCGYMAARKGCLDQHFDNIHQTNIINCQICNKRLKKGSLANHMKFFHSEQNSLNQHCCKMCPFQTIHQASLKSHTENIHQKLKKTKI